jgi:hypothetical protein|nr:MAG TPA: hypothetical protein [Crassvirales sp.]
MACKGGKKSSAKKNTKTVSKPTGRKYACGGKLKK